MQYIGYLFFRFVVTVFSVIPFRVLYALSDALAWLFFYVIKFRYKVIYSNLKNSFPEKTDAEIKEIAYKFYKNMTDILLESIKGFSINESTMAKRYIFTNIDMLHDNHDAGGNSIVMAGHYTNWEWGAIIYPYFLNKRTVVAFYKPLSNVYIEKYSLKKRGRCGTVLVDIGRTAKSFEEYKNQPSTYTFVSDQSTYSQKAHWVKFLNQDTVCPHGGDKYARQYNYPVYFLKMMRVKRGYYTTTLEKLADNSAELPEGEITKRFMQRLEEVIREKPQDWLWSHKRWKVKRKDEMLITPSVTSAKS